jgi:transposase InsO family protein
MDPGSDHSYIHERTLPKGAVPQITRPTPTRTLNGVSNYNRIVELQGILLPEFSRSKRIERPFKCYVSQHDSKVDIILGNDFLIAVGINCNGADQTITWLDNSVPYKTRTYFNDEQQMHMDVHEVAQKQNHLTPEQRDDLGALLSKYTKLFNGELGLYPHRKLHLDLVDDAKPVHKRPYPVAHSHLDIFKNELEHLVKLGVLQRCGASEWAAPTFIVPKKDGRVRWVSDFRELNKLIKRKIYPLPRIMDILQKRSGYKFFTKLDISMQYYTFELDDESKDLCVITTPYGNFKYCRLPMGIKQSPDFAQEIMEDTLRDIKECDVYIDDIGAFNSTWEEHLVTLEHVLTRLQDNNFTINPLKCEWGVQETDWLGYWLTPNGLKPWKKKIEAILNMEHPRNVKEVRSFIGAVTFYRDMFPHRSHILTPLTELTKKPKAKFIWTPEAQKSFAQMKAIIAKDVLIRYPDHNEEFHVVTDASDYQLGAVILQKGAPVAFYSRKLNPAQRNYTTMEKELLSIVETLKEFRTMLYGCKALHVHTDHRNLTYNTINSQRVLRWRLFLEEYQPQFHYIKGTDNTVADALSRLPRSAGQRVPGPCQPKSPKDIQTSLTDTNDADTSFSILCDDQDMMDCFLNYPDVDEQHPFALDYDTIAQAQNNDVALLQSLASKPTQFGRFQMSENANLICYIPGPNLPFKICIPDALLDTIIRFYHLVLNHIGMTRLRDTIAQHFYHTHLQSHVENIVRPCDACQRYKLPGRGHGHLPARNALILPWQEVAVDLIGPWTIKLHGQDYKFHALTSIDTVTNYPEIVRLNNKTSQHVAQQFENSWLARYPKPIRCIYDQGSEFIGHNFQTMLDEYNIIHRPTTVKNPQANAICERLHQTIGNALRVLIHAHPPQNINDAAFLIDTALSTAAYSARAAIHSTLKISPGALVFHRDMILDIPIIADLHLLQQQRQALIDKNLLRANRRRISHDYQPTDEVLLLSYKPDKLDPQSTGPYTIHSVHTNGTVTINRNPFVRERFNIRRLRPYYRA